MQRGILAFIKRYHVILFFLTWFLLNLIQAGNTGLFDDEAYYWVYSRYPDWGYFDHPPMIAIMIKAGYALFHNEFGVRLFIVFINTLTLGLIYSLLPRKNDRLFYAIACSICLLQIGGILAVPDLPLAFFVALFFVTYKSFIRKMSFLNTIFLGVVMALLLYTKYHGILVILFTFFSNPRLALKYQAYLATLIGALLFLPHLLWQYTHGFPSVQYHLVDRSAPSYELSFSMEYLLDQILLSGPFVGWLLLWAAFGYHTRNTFERALKFSMVGIYIFFLVSTIKGRVEANWTLPVLIPLIILSHKSLLNKKNWKRVIFWFVPVNLLLVLFVRIYMMIDITLFELLPKDEFHKNREWAESIHSNTAGLPVVFINSYQKASKYWFYAGVPSFSLNTPTYRRNNYNFWPIEDSLFGKRVAVISPYDYAYYKKRINTPLGITGVLIVDSFFSFSKMKISAAAKPEVINGEITGCSLEISTPESYLTTFQTERFRNKNIELIAYTDKRRTRHFSTGIRLSDITQKEQVVIINLKVNLQKGEYSAGFALPSSLVIDPSLNSSVFKLVVR